MLRVCADPNNLPFSNEARQGFENKLAEMIALDLGAQLEYTWWSERKSFVKNSLNAGRCDVILGLASTVDSVLATQPYYRSTYVFLSRQDRNVEVTSLADERLSKLRIGVHVTGDDYVPPAHALAAQGLSANIVGFSLFGPFGEVNPPAKLVDAVVNGDVDLAIIWGPFAGYFGAQRQKDVKMTPVLPPAWRGVPFQYDISMAVRPDESKLRDELNGALSRNCAAIQSLLATYHIPTVPEDEPKCAPQQQSLVSSR